MPAPGAGGTAAGTATRPTGHTRTPPQGTWTTAAPPWLCPNCGFWQRLVDRPAGCPVCLDPRHAPPRDGWAFVDATDAGRRVSTVWREVEPGLWRFGTDPPLGIGGCGYLVRSDAGNVAFDAAAWYTDAALDQIERLGGIRWAAVSHPHTYGALWRLQERFAPEVSVHVDDVAWTGAFDVTWPFDDRLPVGPGLVLHHTAGHFPGHAVLHDAGRQVLFCGDALKLEVAPPREREATAISTHKGFLRGIPLSHGELRRYRDVLAPLAFEQVWTPFEQGANVGRAATLHALDVLLAGRPTLDGVPVPVSPGQVRAAGKHSSSIKKTIEHECSGPAGTTGPARGNGR